MENGGFNEILNLFISNSVGNVFGYGIVFITSPCCSSFVSYCTLWNVLHILHHLCSFCLDNINKCDLHGKALFIVLIL